MLQTQNQVAIININDTDSVFCGSFANSKKLISLIAENANAHTEKELMIAMHDDKKKQRK